MNDRTKSTIVVENVPEEHFTEEEVRGFFSQFGNIVEVSMQPYKRLAIVKYDNWGSANAAYRSPKVIFDNRFVKVFWYKEQGDSLPPSVPLTSMSTGGSNGLASVQSENATPGPEIDMEEFQRKQDEAQKAHEERMLKKEEVDRQRQELEKKQQGLVAKQLEERLKLQARLAGMKSSADSPAGTVTGEGSSDSKAVSSALRAQLAALEEEAKLLGLDPNATGESSTWPPHPRGRGGFNPRGRGFNPRGFRGGYRGRGGDVHAAYAAFSLDNRPRKVAVAGVDFTASDKDEGLRQYLLVS
jgi:RNA-binding protein 26